MGIVKSYFIKNVWKTILFKYRKIPKVSPRAYIFQRPFLGVLLLEGLTFGQAYLQREICVSKSIGLALQLEVNLPLIFALFYFVFDGNFASTSFWEQGGFLYLEGLFNKRFFALPVWGAYTWRGL